MHFKKILTKFLTSILIFQLIISPCASQITVYADEVDEDTTVNSETETTQSISTDSDVINIETTEPIKDDTTILPEETTDEIPSDDTANTDNISSEEETIISDDNSTPEAEITSEEISDNTISENSVSNTISEDIIEVTEDAEIISDNKTDYEDDFEIPPLNYWNLPDIPVESINDLGNNKRKLLRSATLPSSYTYEDFKSYMPPLRNQNPYGACWAFASIALAEINLRKKGIIPDKDLDLSEAHLAYFAKNSVVDPLGGTAGDKNGTTSLETALNGGGVYEFAEQSFAKWTGAANEITVPYPESTLLNPATLTNPDDSLAFMAEVHLRNSIHLKLTDRDAVKQIIAENGAVEVDYNSEYTNETYNREHNCFYNPQKNAQNHAVCIVGWDDNFPKENFTHEPPHDGAWLIRNSWTTGDYEDHQSYGGYFWMSYDEPSLEKSVYALFFDTADNFDNNYQYDGTVYSEYAHQNNQITAANIFTAKANDSGESLKAISFQSYNTNLDYTIKIYLNPSDNNPESGTLISDATTTGRTTYAGYQTITLNNPVVLSKDDKFSIVVSLQKEGDEISIFNESKIIGRSDYSPSAQSGQSFLLDGDTWIDYGQKYNKNLRIKAFTDNLNSIGPTGLTFNDNLSETGLFLGVTEVKRAYAKVLPEGAKHSRIIWSSSASNIASIDRNGYITGKSYGDATITATIYGTDISSSFKVTVDKRPASITINGKTELKKPETNVYSITSFPSGSEISGEIEWSSDNESVITIENGIATGHAAGYANITASANGKTASLKIKCTPQKPELIAKVDEDGVVTLSWNAVPGADYYQITCQNTLIDTVASNGSSVYSITDESFKNTSVTNVIYAINVYENELYNSNSIYITVGSGYKITYNAGKGTNPPSNPSWYRSDLGYINLKSAIPPTGYTFSGWYEDNTRYRSQLSPSSVTSNLTLVARYSPIYYYISYHNTPENNYYSENNKQQVYYDEPACLNENPFNKTGYNFVNWNDRSDGKGTTYTDKQEIINLISINHATVNLYAQWQPKNFTIRFDPQKGNVDTSFKTVSYNSAYGELPKATRNGYDFKGWFDLPYTSGKEIISSDIVTITSDRTFYAHWSAKQYTVSFDSCGGSAISSKKLTYGSSFGYLNVPYKEGYDFMGWFTDKSDGTEIISSTKFNAETDIVLYAHWKAKEYEIYLDYCDDNNSTIVKTVTFNEPYGYLDSPERNGYSFNGWFTDPYNGDEIKADTIVSIANSHYLYAHWTPDSYTVTFNAGEGTCDLPSIKVTFGNTYGILPEAYKEGSTFIGWYTAKSGGTLITSNDYVLAKENNTLYARYSDTNETFVFFDPNGGECNTASKALEYGEPYGTLPEAHLTDYNFIGWYTLSTGGEKITETDIVTNASSHKLYAHYENTTVYVEDVILSPSELSLKIGDKSVLIAIVTPTNATNKAIKWESETPYIAEVDENGNVTAMNQGETYIKVSTMDGNFEAKCKVTVSSKETTPTEPQNPTEPENTTNPEEPKNVPEEKQETKPTELKGENLVVKEKIIINNLFNEKFNTSYAKYSVSPKGYATVNSKGQLICKKSGTITVTGQVKNGKKWEASNDTITLTIDKPSFKEKTITATKPESIIDAAGNLKDTESKPDKWTSSKPNVAKIDSSTGLITTVGKGSTKITAYYGEGKNAAKYSFTIKVKIPVINKSKASLITGATLKLKLKNTKIQPVWSVSGNNEVSVDDNGKVTALKATSEPVKVIATIDGVDYPCEITIKEPLLSKSNISIKANKTTKLKWKNTKFKNTDAKWETSEPGIIQVDNGIIKGISSGTATITTTLGGITKTCQITVM